MLNQQQPLQDNKYYSIQDNSLGDNVFLKVTDSITSVWEKLKIPKIVITIISIIVIISSIYTIHQQKFLVGSWLLITSYLYNVARQFYLQDTQSTQYMLQHSILLILQYSCLLFIIYKMDLSNKTVANMIYVVMISIILINFLIWQCTLQNRKSKIISNICKVTFLQRIIQVTGNGTLIVIVSCLLAYLCI